MAHETLIGFEDAEGRRELEERVEALEEERDELRDEVANLKQMVLNIQGLVISGLQNGNHRESGLAPGPYEAPAPRPETQKGTANTTKDADSKPKGRPTRCTVVQSDPQHGYVLYASDGEGKPAICCLRPKLWVDVDHEEGEETTAIVPYSAKWYRPIPLTGQIIRSGPKAILFEYEGQEVWIYRAQVAVFFFEGDDNYDLATTDALNRIPPKQEVTLIISPFMAQKIGLIEDITEREAKLV